MIKINKNTPADKAERTSLISFISEHRAILPASIVVLYIIVFSILHTRVFLSAYNITSVLLELSVPIIMVIGISLVLVCGEIDLSLGYNVLFSNMLVGTLVILRVPPVLAIFMTIAVGATIGFLVGVLVTRCNVNSFIATLASGLIFYGFALYVNAAGTALSYDVHTVYRLPSNFNVIMQYQLVPGMNLQIPIIYALIICSIFLYLVTKTKYFSQYYFVGANRTAAHLSGINSASIKTVAFTISAALSSVGGVIMCGRLGMCGSTVGIGWELQIITAAVIGGVSFKGGRGTLFGAFAGALLLVCINNGMRISDVPSTVYNIVYGFILLLAVVIDTLLGNVQGKQQKSSFASLLDKRKAEPV